jgi:hypothetical protein
MLVIWLVMTIREVLERTEKLSIFEMHLMKL